MYLERSDEVNEKKKVNSTEFFVALISAFYCYAGATNRGFSSLLMVIPFVCILIFLALATNNKLFRAAISVWFIICTTLFILKADTSKLYNPTIGKKVKTTIDLCVIKIRFDDGKFYNYFDQYDAKKKCRSSRFDHEDFIEGKLVNKNSVFEIKEVRVSHPEMTEVYKPMVDTTLGKVELTNYKDSNNVFFLWENGTQIEFKDFIRPILYYPTILLLFPFLLIAYGISFFNFNKLLKEKRAKQI